MADPPFSPWTPLRQPLYRSLWIAAVASNIGTWLQSVGASWMMTTLSASATMVALVQAATSLPMFLLSLPAGALADVLDRRRLLLFTEIWEERARWTGSWPSRPWSSRARPSPSIAAELPSPLPRAGLRGRRLALPALQLERGDPDGGSLLGARPGPVGLHADLLRRPRGRQRALGCGGRPRGYLPRPLDLRGRHDRRPRPTWRIHLPGEGLNLAPSRQWPAPLASHDLELDRGPVLVSIRYRIDPEKAAEFAAAMRELRRIRLRDGALQWGLFTVAQTPGAYAEVFLVRSWVEHLRQHERVTVASPSR